MNKTVFHLIIALGATFAVAAQVVPEGSISLPAMPAFSAYVAPANPSADEQRLFAEAVRQYRAGRYSAAYGRFVALADRGHVRASRIALGMYKDGTQLYNTAWDAAPSQLAAWELAAQPERATVAAMEPRQ